MRPDRRGVALPQREVEQILVRQLDVTAFPLVGQSGRELGAVALFWSEGLGSSSGESAAPSRLPDLRPPGTAETPAAWPSAPGRATWWSSTPARVSRRSGGRWAT